MKNNTRLLTILFLFAALISLGCASKSASQSTAHSAPRSTAKATAQHTQTATYTQSGKASYYSDKFQGRKTASGQPYNRNAMTAAHRKLPFGTKVRVTNTKNGKSVVVRINDRGPFTKGRIIDLSRAAFSAIGNISAGVLNVKIEVLK